MLEQVLVVVFIVYFVGAVSIQHQFLKHDVGSGEPALDTLVIMLWPLTGLVMIYVTWTHLWLHNN